MKSPLLAVSFSFFTGLGYVGVNKYYLSVYSLTDKNKHLFDIKYSKKRWKRISGAFVIKDELFCKAAYLHLYRKWNIHSTLRTGFLYF